MEGSLLLDDIEIINVLMCVALAFKCLCCLENKQKASISSIYSLQMRKHKRVNEETHLNFGSLSPFLSHSVCSKIQSNTPMAIMNCWEHYLTLVV